jgi:glutathione S-transferase
VKLYFFQGSCAALTARLELEYKGLEYQLVYLPPVAHGFILGVRGFGRQTVPALELDDERVSGTLEISRVLDRLKPEPPLHPGDERIEEAERWGEELQNAQRRILYAATRRKPSAWSSMVLPGQRRAIRAVWRGLAYGLVPFASWAHGGSDERAHRDLAELPSRLDRIDAWIEEGVLDGEDLNAADFEIAPSIRSFLQFADLAQLVSGRPAERHARRVLPEFPGHVAAVLPRDWLSQPRSASSSRR